MDGRVGFENEESMSSKNRARKVFMSREVSAFFVLEVDLRVVKRC